MLGGVLAEEGLTAETGFKAGSLLISDERLERGVSVPWRSLLIDGGFHSRNLRDSSAALWAVVSTILFCLGCSRCGRCDSLLGVFEFWAVVFNDCFATGWVIGSRVDVLSWLFCGGPGHCCSRIEAVDLRDNDFKACFAIIGDVDCAVGDDGVGTSCAAGVFLFNFKADDLRDVDFKGCFAIDGNVDLTDAVGTGGSGGAFLFNFIADGNARIFVIVAVSCPFRSGNPVSAGFDFGCDIFGSNSVFLLSSDNTAVGCSTHPCIGIAVWFAESFV